MRTGGCQCGRVRFQFDVEPSDASYCHCSICRKLSGSAFAAYIEINSESLKLADRQSRLNFHDVTPRLSKGFCVTCGTTMFTRHASFPGYTYISLGALDSSDGIVPEYHQFVGSKAAWYTIDDDLPQYEEWPPE